MIAIEEIEKIVRAAIQESDSGLTKENPKFDFKSMWYNLKSESGIMEFLKDTSAIANTIGLDGFIVIGYDEGNKKRIPARFADSRLSDPSEVNGILSKHLSPVFDLAIVDLVIDQSAYSVIHIPPSLDKPHCIKKFCTYDKANKERSFPQEIFVRHGTSNDRANRYDLDLMYYDRKNLEPEYSIHTYLTGSNFSNCNQVHLRLSLSLIIENSGRRPVSIREIEFQIHNPFAETQDILFKGSENLEEKLNGSIGAGSIVINPKTIRKFSNLIFLASNPNIKYDDISALNILHNVIKNSEEIIFKTKLVTGLELDQKAIVCK